MQELLNVSCKHNVRLREFTYFDFERLSINSLGVSVSELEEYKSSHEWKF